MARLTYREYKVIAKDLGGDRYKFTVKGYNKTDVRKAFKQQGYKVTSIVEVKSKRQVFLR